jgi:hypothetical protein
MIGFDIGNAARIDAARFFTIFPVSVRVPRMRARRYQRYRRGNPVPLPIAATTALEMIGPTPGTVIRR